MTVVEVPSGTHMAGTWLGGRFRLDERISVGEHTSGSWGEDTSGSGGGSWEADGLALWKATDQLLNRPVTVYLLPPGLPVPPRVIEAVQAAAKISDPRLATVYDTDFSPECPYIVSEWTPGTHLEDLLLSGLPTPALAAAMIADAADALATVHQAGLAHLRLTPRSLRWDSYRGLKITGLGLDAALCGPAPGGTDTDDPMVADTMALARMLYALLTGYWPGLTGYWPGEEAAALPPAPRHKGRVCTPRQVRAGVPAILDAITYRALRGQAPDAPARPLTPAGLAMALRGVQRPSFQLDPPEDVARPSARVRESVARPPARHARARAGIRHRTTLLYPAA
jgi:serine/threonine protein kinase